MIAMRSTPPMFNKNTNNFCFRNCLNSIRYVLTTTLSEKLAVQLGVIKFILHLRWVMEHRPDRVSKKDCLVMQFSQGIFLEPGNGGDGFGKDTYEQMRWKCQLFEIAM